MTSTSTHRIPTRRGITRRPMSTCAGPALESAIAREMARYNVSRSFVLNTCAAFALGVKDEPDYRDLPSTTRRRARNRK